MKLKPLIFRPTLVGVDHLLRRFLIFRNHHLKLTRVQEQVSSDGQQDYKYRDDDFPAHTLSLRVVAMKLRGPSGRQAKRGPAGREVRTIWGAKVLEQAR